MMTNKNLTLPPDWEKNVSRMWQCVRKHDCDIPSEDLDLMREILLQAQQLSGNPVQVLTEIEFRQYEAFSMAVRQVSKEREELQSSFDSEKVTKSYADEDDENE